MSRKDRSHLINCNSYYKIVSAVLLKDRFNPEDNCVRAGLHFIRFVIRARGFNGFKISYFIVVDKLLMMDFMLL